MSLTRIAAALIALATALPMASYAQGTTTPKSTGKTLSGGNKPAGKLLTRNELRACMKTQDTLKSGRSDLESERAALDREKAELVQAGDALRAERTALERQRNETVSAYNAKVANREARMTAWNQRNAALAEMVRSKKGDKAEMERERADLEREKAELIQLDEALKAEAPQIESTSSQAVAAYNAKATANDQKVEDWNKRSAAGVERANAWRADNDNWKRDCADRPYREDDEIAIKAGK
jgi:chromosome segregation ATPase